MREILSSSVLNLLQAALQPHIGHSTTPTPSQPVVCLAGLYTTPCNLSFLFFAHMQVGWIELYFPLFGYDCN